jgi:hypothetical protein
MRSILPIGLLFSGSLILSNTAYLYLSVAYIQMLKVMTSFPFRGFHLLISDISRRRSPPLLSSLSRGLSGSKSPTASWPSSSS